MVSSQALARSVPFALYLAVLALEGVAAQQATAFDARWLYPAKISAVVLALWYYRREYAELALPPDRRAWLWGVPVGLLVFVLWINLDFGFLDLGGGEGYDPRDASGNLNWVLVTFRLLGAALVVPVMEELFWRSFLMRWLDGSPFWKVEATRATLKAVLISSVLFGVEHTLWFAGILAGLAYAWLYRASGSLWPPVVAHAVTNLTLGIWILHTGQWTFW
jgi:CAAX prenyl protease-like protein